MFKFSSLTPSHMRKMSPMRKTATPAKSHSLSQQPLSLKNLRSCQALLFENLVGGSTPPSRKGLHTMKTYRRFLIVLSMKRVKSARVNLKQDSGKIHSCARFFASPERFILVKDILGNTHRRSGIGNATNTIIIFELIF